MSILHLPSTADVLLLYPGDSLRDQIRSWSQQHPWRQVETSFERSLPEIRKLLRVSSTVLVDATDDPSQATDAFLQAIARLGSHAVAMYSEETPDGLELFVRLHGPLFILGPLFAHQWAEFFELFLENENARPAGPALEQPRLPPPLWLDREAMLRQWFAYRFRGSLDRPITRFY